MRWPWSGNAYLSFSSAAVGVEQKQASPSEQQQTFGCATPGWGMSKPAWQQRIKHHCLHAPSRAASKMQPTRAWAGGPAGDGPLPLALLRRHLQAAWGTRSNIGNSSWQRCSALLAQQQFAASQLLRTLLTKWQAAPAGGRPPSHRSLCLCHAPDRCQSKTRAACRTCRWGSGCWRSASWPSPCGPSPVGSKTQRGSE